MPFRRYAAIDVNTLPDFLVFAPAVAKWMGAKIILDMHEITPEFYMSKYGIAPDSWVVRIMEFLEKISFNFADHVITINEPVQDLLARRGLPPAKSTVIMNSVDETQFTSHPLSLPAVEAEAQSATYVMMYHGTVTGIYGLDIAVEAFALAEKDMPGAQFWILGKERRDSDWLDSLVRERGLVAKVKLFGFLPPKEIPAWLNKCDVGILPLRRDALLEFATPNKLSELIIMGKAVTISRLKTIRHYFSENALAYFEPNNSTDLAKQMIRLYRDSDLRARLAAQAKLEYAPIRWDVMQQRYLSLMEAIVGNSGQTAVRKPKAACTTAVV